MRYLHTMLRVNDLEKNLHFFCDLLGLKEISKKENEKGRFTLIFLAAPNSVLCENGRPSPLIELTYNWPDKDGANELYEFSRGFGHLAFEVDDIYALCSKLQENGVVINRPPRDGKMAFVKSPQGASIELLQKGDALEIKEPWVTMKNEGTW